ncbi:MAG: serine/threonine protein kinase, partial [Planctomycetaceae bacterium]|nr:serine/threonine protein kinase [Planctomycetaceae bacterium]
MATPSDSSHHGRFLPGTRVAGRYRIVSRVGKGGMGEVYRADDLRLGHTVALKFLPKELAADARRREYFLSEVRLTRQISHPNVCRVYDIGEVDGQQFLSMEYIDGEDLRVLLRRIGRLPADKGVQIAQQLCAGLAAAHDKGVLHRDLKPANIMIDGQGQVRITDFGLAKLSSESTPREISGTPAYMAPEQLLFGETSPQSDLYSLGLVLAEVFLGRSINTTNDPDRLVAQLQSSMDSAVHLDFDEIDPVVKRAVLSCLAREPGDRPASARQLANLLPGADPLEATIAAGMTPSPELVANATDRDLLQFPVAIAMLILTCALLALSAYATQKRMKMLETPPEALSARCVQIVETLGYSDLPENSVRGAEFNSEIQKELRESVRDEQWLAQQRRPKFRFWSRWTDGVFLVDEFHTAYRITETTPIDQQETEIKVVVDEHGSLTELLVEGQKPADPSTIPPGYDWDALLDLAGIDQTRVTEIAPVVDPPVFCEQRIAWQVATDKEVLTIQAGAVGGRANYFEMIASDRSNRSVELRNPPLFM